GEDVRAEAFVRNVRDRARCGHPRDPSFIQNSDILPTNSQLKPGLPTAIIRASAKWCKSDGGSKAAALSSSLCCSPTARSRVCQHGGLNPLRLVCGSATRRPFHSKSCPRCVP